MPSPDDQLGALDADLDQDPRVAQALEEAARTEARAATARGRARRLRQQVETAAREQLDTKAPADSDDVDGAAVEDNVDAPEQASASSARLRRRRFRRPTRQTLAVIAAILLTGAGAAVSGYVVWHHHALTAEHRRAAEFEAAARQRVITLMSINADTARKDVQHIIDDSTGSFKAKMLITADDLVKTMERSKISTKVAVKSVVVESMTNDSAVVLVAAKADATGPGKDTPPPPPRSWRIIMTLQRDGGQLKMADIEMLP
jgi:Mce-associated membrane protein